MESGYVDSRLGNQSSQPGNDVQGRTNAASAWVRKNGEVQWFEYDVRGAVSIRCFVGIANISLIR